VYEDAFEEDRPRRGRRALIAAWLGVAAALGGVVGYVFLMPADESELSRYGQVSVPLNPAQTASTATDTSGASGTAATDTATSTATGTGTTGTATTTGTTAGGSGTSGQASGETDGSDTSADGITGDSITTEGATTATTGTGTAQTADGASRTGSPEPSAATGGAGSADGGTDEQVANLPDAPDAPDSGASGDATSGEATSGDVSGESAVTTNAPQPQWQQYARVLSPPDGVDRIAVVVRGLGLSSAATEAAIERLPGEISLSFSPYARRSVEWTLRARARGHEVLMDLPMEPRSYPSDDPGPKALMTSKPTPKNLENLKWILGKGRELVGVVGQMGSAFVKNKRAVSPVLRHLKQRGLIYVDNGDVPGNAAVTAAEELGLPNAVNTRTLDDGQISRPAIRGRLVAAEREAKQQGQAVVMAHPYPVTIDLLQQWSRNLAQRGLALVPITNIVRSPDRTEAAQLR